MMENYEAQLIINTKNSLAEAPFLNEKNGTISFVDITEGKLYVMDEQDVIGITEPKKLDELCKRYFELDQMIGAAVPRADGEYVIAATDGFYKTEGTSLNKIFDTSNYYKSNQRSNDAKCDCKGRLYVGSSVYVDGDEASGDLYCYDNVSMRIVQKDTLIANGMAWNKAKDKFYFSDSLYHCVFVYDYDKETGNISNRQVLKEIEDGVPDGMCIDSDDNLWLAVWGGKRIEHIDTKTGQLIGLINVDATNVTSCCFYGDKKDTLFITTSGASLDGAGDGRIFSCKVSATGVETDYCNI